MLILLEIRSYFNMYNILKNAAEDLMYELLKLNYTNVQSETGKEKGKSITKSTSVLYPNIIETLVASRKQEIHSFLFDTSTFRGGGLIQKLIHTIMNPTFQKVQQFCTVRSMLKQIPSDRDSDCCKK